MVYAIVFEFHCQRKREIMRRLASISVGESACMMDVSAKDPRAVCVRIVDALAVAMALDRDDVIGEGEVLYVIPVDDVAGCGNANVDGWAERRGLLSKRHRAV